MMDEFENFSFFGEEDKPLPSTDWKWSFKDYPKEKNGLKVFSCCNDQEDREQAHRAGRIRLRIEK